MKKLIIILFAIVFCTSSFAGDVVSVNCGGDFYSHYMWRGHCLAYESFQPYVGFNVSTLYDEAISISCWWSLSRGLDNSFYKEVNVSADYTSTGNFFNVGMTFLDYLEGPGARQIDIHAKFGGGYLLPLYGTWCTYVVSGFNGSEVLEHCYETYASIVYEAELGNNWTLTPEVGAQFGLSGPIGDYYDVPGRKFMVSNISLSATKTFEVHELVSVDVKGGFVFNLYDVGVNDFTYGKNANVWVGVGFYFER